MIDYHNHVKSAVLLRNKVGGGQQKYQGQILVGFKGLQWHRATSHWHWKLK
jgi:hypothetical protein